MNELTKLNSRDFLQGINFLEGGNVKQATIDLDHNKIQIIAQMECSETIVLIEIRDIVQYKLCDLVGISLLGLSGDPHSLMIEWFEDSVIVVLGSCVKSLDYDELLNAEFFIEAKQIYTAVR